MIGKIIWPASGDAIPFRVSRPDVFEYYIDCLKRDDKTQFRQIQSSIDPMIVDRLRGNLERTRPIENRGIKILQDWDGDLLDQKFLNQVHHDWVISGQKYPALPSILRAQGGRDQDYREINTTLHALESMFTSQYCNYTHDPYQINNLFGCDIMEFKTDSVMMGFDNLGRSSWNKFLYWDDNVNDIDTNDHQHLSGLLNINLHRPTIWSPPKNYVDWCEQHNQTVVGHRICLGTFIDLDRNLTKYRHIMLANHEQSDTIILEISSQ